MGSEAVEEDFVHEIYPAGDTLLLCSPSEVKLLVHSIFLKIVPKAFEAMLGPNFREGQPQTNGESREIPLPEYDPFTMQIIRNMAHSRGVPDTMSPSQSLAIAYAAGKYDVVSILKFASSRWVSSANRSLSRNFRIEDTWNKMIGAYVLKDPESFSSVSASIVLNYKESFRNMQPLLGNIMLPDIILIFKEKRNLIRMDILQLLLRRACCGQASCRCGWNAKHTFAWIQMLEENRSLPEEAGDQNLEMTIWKIENMRESQDVEENTERYNSRWHRKPDWRCGLITQLNEFGEDAGVCLETFRDIVANGECRSAK